MTSGQVKARPIRATGRSKTSIRMGILGKALHETPAAVVIAVTTATTTFPPAVETLHEAGSGHQLNFDESLYHGVRVMAGDRGGK